MVDFIQDRLQLRQVLFVLPWHFVWLFLYGFGLLLLVLDELRLDYWLHVLVDEVIASRWLALKALYQFGILLINCEHFTLVVECVLKALLLVMSEYRLHQRHLWLL